MNFDTAPSFVGVAGFEPTTPCSQSRCIYFMFHSVSDIFKWYQKKSHIFLIVKKFRIKLILLRGLVAKETPPTKKNHRRGGVNKTKGCAVAYFMLSDARRIRFAKSHSAPRSCSFSSGVKSLAPPLLSLPFNLWCSHERDLLKYFLDMDAKDTSSKISCSCCLTVTVGVFFSIAVVSIFFFPLAPAPKAGRGGCLTFQ